MSDNICDTASACIPAFQQYKWKAQAVQLKFQIGEIVIGTVTLSSLTLSANIIDLVNCPPEHEISFEEMPKDTDVLLARSYPIPQILPKLKVLSRSIRYIPNQYQRHYVDLSDSFTLYLSKFSSKSRANIRKKNRIFKEFSNGKIVWKIYSFVDMDDFHRTAFKVSEKTYQARLLGSGLPEIAQFKQQLAKLDDARGYILFHNCDPIAYIFSPKIDCCLLYQYVGYDPKYAQWSPGSILQFLALESMFNEGRFKAFDFTEGEGAHKEFFGNRSILCGDIFHFRKSLKNFLLVILHYLLNGVSLGVVKLLNYFGLKARIKKLIRSKISRAKPS